MTTKRLGRGLGLALMVLTFAGITSASAFAAGSTCYTGCSPPTTIQTGGGGGGTGAGGGGGGTGSGGGGSGGTRPPVTKSSGGGSGSSGSGSSGSSAAKARSTASSGGSLPFTGADIEELTAFGAGALLIGGVLVRRSRNRRRVQA
jgi:hypothetical protein